jgi:multiple sugar transport system substrate-binding protein
MNISSILGDSRRLVYILGGAIALMVFVTIIYILTSFGGQSSGEQVTLQVWGVFDDQAAFGDAIKAFEKENKNIKVDYKLIPFKDYEQAVLNGLAAGSGPDVWMIHDTWLPKHIDKLRPLPAKFPDMKDPLMTVRQFKDLFVDVAYTDLVNDDKIYAMPLYADTLALYYNKDMLSSAGIAQPPRTWTEFMDDVKILTKLDDAHNILISGAAIGSARNINRSTDILMMLMLQSGVRMTSDDNGEATFAHSVDGQPVGERSLQFYTDFTNPQKEVYTWNDAQDYSIDAFAAGKTATMINYSHQISTLRDKAPRLNWAIAPVPQATLSDKRTYADYWPLAVTLQSKHPYEAWRLVYYLTAGAGNVSYLNAAVRPAARHDLIDQQKTDPDLGVFAEQALTARSWFQVDNQAIETIFADMIDNVNLGRQSIQDALRQAEDKVSVLMSGR